MKSVHDLSKKKKLAIKLTGIGILLAVLAVLIVVVVNKQKSLTTAPQGESSQTTAQEEDWASTITYKGSTYKKNENISTVLFLGVDSSEKVEFNDVIGTGGRADTIILFIVDSENKTVQMLSVSRNTMTTVDVYKKNGDYGYSGVMQVTMQFAYSDSLARGSYLMRNKISDVLCGITIDDYFTMTLDGIAAIVDELGGVTITIESDCTDIDPSYTEGAAVTLDGSAAEKFVRYRDTDTAGSNEDRVARQAWFIKQFFSQFKNISKSRLADILDSVEKYIETDMYADDISDLMKFSFKDESLVAPGESASGLLHDEFYIDNDRLQDLLIDLLYTKVN